MIVSMAILPVLPLAGCGNKTNREQEPWDRSYFKQERQRSEQTTETLRHRLQYSQVDR
ncbi:MAG: hypothetical protein GWN53_11565 [Gammaproteobacteria bacterium]|nr:hypothetical protein [Gammaproteobacteria bacterium]NIW86468.1 hypothetical protein [Gammaproteobacteria bacterium]